MSMELLLETCVDPTIRKLLAWGPSVRVGGVQQRDLPRDVWMTQDLSEMDRFLLAVGGNDGCVVAFADR